MSTINVDTISDTAGSGSPNFPNGVDSTKIRLSSTAGINLTSLNHAFQVGTVDSEVNLRIDRDEIQTVDNGVASQLRVNTRGGEVLIGKAGGTDAVNLRGVIRHNGVDVGSTTIYDTGSFDISNSTQYTFTHGLGSIPDFCAVYLVCIASSQGFSVGDIIQISAQGNVDSGDEGTHIELTATTFIVRIGSNGPAEYVRKNSFATAALSSSAFNMQIKAFKF